MVGDGRNILFCMDGWRGSPLLILLCTFLPLSLKHRANSRTVHDALVGRCWVQDIQDALLVAAYPNI